ncbi:hypothetical protein AMATHDRAFT_54045 [Amanita thiersii Skay4041]|uniref:F-box domain-containing protein n=1 Tax=Amanita thiersii Skay4041 TaxID=703135 RepID=A0A2A9NRQ4_9AGAR|nr:hypothetical protein AMATHDRAFT_54045 [Amanita thiersii Skay4041]
MVCQAFSISVPTVLPDIEDFKITQDSSQARVNTCITLPEDLEREIVEVTISLYPQTALTLCRVVSTFQRWAERLLYRTVLLNSNSSALRFIHTINCRPASFFSENIKQLWLFNSVNRLEAEKILAACSRITTLGWWPSNATTDLSLDLVASSDITYLSLSGPPAYPRMGLNYLPLASGRFPNVTHLEIVNICYMQPRYESWLHLSGLPRLTHLALGGFPPDIAPVTGAVTRILASCCSLKLLALVSHSCAFSRSLECHPSTADPRVIVLTTFTYTWYGIGDSLVIWETVELLATKRSHHDKTLKITNDAIAFG